MNATRFGDAAHAMVHDFEYLARGFRARGQSARGADQLAYAHVLARLGYQGEELLSQVRRMFPDLDATRPDDAGNRQQPQQQPQQTKEANA